MAVGTGYGYEAVKIAIAGAGAGLGYVPPPTPPAPTYVAAPPSPQAPEYVQQKYREAQAREEAATAARAATEAAQEAAAEAAREAAAKAPPPPSPPPPLAYKPSPLPVYVPPPPPAAPEYVQEKYEERIAREVAAVAPPAPPVYAPPEVVAPPSVVPPLYVTTREAVTKAMEVPPVPPAPPPFVPALIPELTFEEYETYRHLPGEQQLQQQVAWGVIQEGSEFAGWTSDPKTGKGYWTYHTPEELASRATREAALADLMPFRVNGGYSLAAAFAAGKGADVYTARRLGLFTPEQVLESQLGQIKASSLARAKADITRIAPLAVTEGGIYLEAALAGGVPESTLRLAGFSGEDVAAAVAKAGALAELEPFIVIPEISEQLIYEELKRGVPVSETVAKIEDLPGGYALPAALEAGIAASTLRLAGFTLEQVKAAEVVAFAPPVIVGKKGEFAGFEAAGEYAKEVGAPGYVPSVEEYSGAHPEMSAGDVIRNYEKQYGEVSRSTGLLGITHYPGGSSKWEYESVPTSLRGIAERETYPEAPLSIEGFTAQFIAGLERPVGAGTEWEEAMGTVARRTFREIYGTGAVVTGIPPSLAAMITPPGRVFFPEVTIGEITWPEWTIMGGQIAAITAPYWAGPLRGIVTKVPGFRRFAPVPKPGLVYPTVTEPYGFPGAPTVKVPLPPQNGLGVVSPLAPRFYEIYPGPAYVPYTGAPITSVGGIRAPTALIPGGTMGIPLRPEGFWKPFLGGPSPGIPPIVPPSPISPITATKLRPGYVHEKGAYWRPAGVVEEPGGFYRMDFATGKTWVKVSPGEAMGFGAGISPVAVVTPAVFPEILPVVTPVVIPEVTPLEELKIIPGVMPVVVPIVAPLVVEPEVFPEVIPITEPLPEKKPEPPVVIPIVTPAVFPEVPIVEEPWITPTPIEEPFPVVEPIPGITPTPALVPAVAYEPSILTPPAEYPAEFPFEYPFPEPFIPPIIPSIIIPPIIPPVEVVPPTEPPPPEEPIPPFFPLLGWPTLGAGFARGRRAPRGLFGERGWIFPELIISFPDPFKLERRKVRLAKKRKIPYGKRILRPSTISARKIRA